MSSEIIEALISSIIGGVLVAIVNHLFSRRKTEAETEKIKAETEKLRVEAAKIRSEIAKVSNETAKLEDTVERAASVMSGSYFESEASRQLIEEVIQAIHKYLRRRKSDRGERQELLKVILPIVKDNATMAEYMIDTLISKGYLIETSPSRYEISRTAKQRFISGGIR